MTTVDEDLLLNEPEAAIYDSAALLDEELLLDGGEVSGRPTHESIDDPFPTEPVAEQHHENEEEEEEDDVESEKEELDYDEEEEDEERRERTSRYASEKKGAVRNDVEGDENKKDEEKNKRAGIPSLFDKTITNNPMKSGDQPIGVILRIEGEQERIFYPPPNFMDAQPAIVPRLPNGIPLISTLPSSHGRAGFGLGYQAQSRLVGGGGVSGGGQWDQAVAMFLNGGQPAPSSRSRGSRKRRSSSYSSSSSGSSDSRSRSRSSSRSDRRRRDRRRRDDHRRDRDRDDRRDRRRHDERRAPRDSKRRRESKSATIESAKALGLSNEYIDRVAEQKRKRDEVVRKKEERRHGKEAPAASVSSASSSAGKEKTKAFLAVNVSGVEQLPTAVKKIEAIATELGPIKKCWRSADDTVSIIFNAHDKAKDFMIKYNGKVLSGLRISVSLEKKFLNLAEVS